MTNSLDFKQTIALTLRQARKQKGLSLDKTAKLTGVSKAMLGQIEREESSPTIQKLWQIATGLELSFSSFFADMQDLNSAHRQTFPNDLNMQVESQFPFNPLTQMESFIVTLVHHHEQTSQAHQFGVVEHIWVLEGSIQVQFDGIWHQLESGETCQFNADQPHGYRAVTKNARFQNIICYPVQTSISPSN